MNRRTFAIASTIGLATIVQDAAAQRTRDTKTAVSEYTGGVVDYSNTQLEFVNSHIDETDKAEHFHFKTAAGSKFDIAFWPRELGPSVDLVNWYIDMIESNNLGDIQDDDHFDDGGWFIMDTGYRDYYEYQIGSYPEHDLVTLTWNYDDELEFILEEAQKILVDGMPPMLFLEESGVMTASAPTRKTRTAGSTADTDTDTTTASDAVEQVRQHQQDFHASLENGSESLSIISDESASESAKQDAFLTLLNNAAEWMNAPIYAKKVVFTADEAELQSLYLTWADLLGAFGSALESVLLGVGSGEDLTAAERAFSPVDQELTDMLSTTVTTVRWSTSCKEQKRHRIL